jgi:hypothetical protein
MNLASGVPEWNVTSMDFYGEGHEEDETPESLVCAEG